MDPGRLATDSGLGSYNLSNKSAGGDMDLDSAIGTIGIVLGTTTSLAFISLVPPCCVPRSSELGYPFEGPNGFTGAGFTNGFELESSRPPEYLTVHSIHVYTLMYEADVFMCMRTSPPGTEMHADRLAQDPS
eukprot:552665-Amorphochlora_amoeboformis.AAC.1